ncbi:MAG: hypothetical protein ACNA8P_11980 [Phycisphaerales bacterium]
MHKSLQVLKAATLISLAGILGACSCSDCKQRAIRELEIMKTQMRIYAQSCCIRPENEQASCLSEAAHGVAEALGRIPAIMDACQARNWELLDKLWQEAKSLLPWTRSSAQVLASGEVVNTYPVFLPSEQVNVVLDANRTNSTPVSAVMVDGDVYSTDAAANAQVLAGPNATVTQIPSTSQNPVLLHTYTLQVSTIEVQTPHGNATFSVNGSVGVTDFFATNTPGTVRASVASLSWSITFMGELFVFDLIKSSPHNNVTIDATGSGTIQVVGRLVSTERPFYHNTYDSIVLSLPIDFLQDHSGFVVSTPGFVDGDEIAPWAQPEPFVAGQGPCADTNGNGIPDFADQIRESIDEAINNLCPDHNND